MITTPYEILNSAIENSLNEFKSHPEIFKTVYGNGDNSKFLKGRLLKGSNIIELASSERLLLMKILNYSIETKDSLDVTFFRLSGYRLVEKASGFADMKSHIEYSGEIFPTLQIILHDYVVLTPFEFKIDLTSYF